MRLLQRPRLVVRLASAALLIAALWLLLVPRMAVYYVDDQGRSYDIGSTDFWGKGDQTMLLPALLLEEDGPMPADGFVTSVRVGCGTSFTAGENETTVEGDGSAACAEIETSRRIAGLSLVALGLIGFIASPRLSESRGSWVSTRDLTDS